MDRDRILQNMQALIDAHVQQGGDRRNTRFRRMVSIARDIRRARNHAGRRTSAELLEHECLAPLRARIDQIKIVALDLEWSPEGPAFDEMGIAVWDHGSITAVRNLRTTSARASERSLHGRTIPLTVDESLDVLSHHLRGADHVAMHAGRNDRMRLAMADYSLPDLPVIDTASWHRRAAGDRHDTKLAAICGRWRIPHAKRHVAANDAVATLRVALSMIRYGPNPILDAHGSCIHGHEPIPQGE